MGACALEGVEALSPVVGNTGVGGTLAVVLNPRGRALQEAVRSAGVLSHCQRR
jgi:hypothetical protein